MTIHIEPDPPREGEQATVTVSGGGPYFVRVDGGEWSELPVDAESGTATLDIPAGSGGQVLDISDLAFPAPDNAETLIVGTD